MTLKGSEKRRSILIVLTGLLIFGVASIFTVGYLQSRISALPNSSLRVQDGSDLPLNKDLVRQILASEFDGMLNLDERSVSPSYVFADFNGDGVTDLAAAVAVIPEISSDDTSPLAFRFEKPNGPSLNKKSTQVIRMRKGNLKWYRDHQATIIAIVHGSLAHGLRSTKAEQRFVLVDGWQNGKLKLQSYGGALQIARYGDESELVPPPKLKGIGLILIGIDNEGTVLYWDGTAYRWYPVPESA